MCICNAPARPTDWRRRARYLVHLCSPVALRLHYCLTGRPRSLSLSLSLALNQVKLRKSSYILSLNFAHTPFKRLHFNRRNTSICSTNLLLLKSLQILLHFVRFFFSFLFVLLFISRFFWFSYKFLPHSPVCAKRPKSSQFSDPNSPINPPINSTNVLLISLFRLIPPVHFDFV